MDIAPIGFNLLEGKTGVKMTVFEVFAIYLRTTWIILVIHVVQMKFQYNFIVKGGLKCQYFGRRYYPGKNLPQGKNAHIQFDLSDHHGNQKTAP